MGKTARDRRPNLRPPKRIALEEKPSRGRVILLIVCIIVAVASISYGVTALIRSRDKSGFTEITSSGVDPSVADDFRFFYQLGDKGGNALYKTLSGLYEDACETAYRLFSAEETFDGMSNLASLSASPNEIMTVDEPLYRALELLVSSGSRVPYLAPIELHFRSVFYITNDIEASEYDIAKNPTLRAYYGELAAFARDPDAISIELLGDCRVRLKVSDEYLAYAEAMELTALVSFGYFKNAFICDYLAECFAEAGYVEGYFSSYDGFTRNLDLASERSYSFNLFCRKGNEIDLAASLDTKGVGALVYLRNYPISAHDDDRIYVFESGATLTEFLDPTDGGSRTATANLVLYRGDSCAEMILSASAIWVAETLDEAALSALSCDFIWCVDGEIRCSDENAPIYDLSSDYRKVKMP